MSFDDEVRVLELAHDWKTGKLTPVHPSVGRALNTILVRNGEDPVPFSRATDELAPSLVDLIRAEHERARTRRNRALAPGRASMLADARARVHERRDVGIG